MIKGNEGDESAAHTTETNDGLRATDLQTFVKFDAVKLAGFWCALNRWQWPAEIPDPEDPKAHLFAGMRLTRRMTLMRWIEATVSERLISRAWNDDMTDEEHDDFWRGFHENDVEARERYDKRQALGFQRRLARTRTNDAESAGN